MARQVYLGDGAYATVDKDAFHPLILTTGHHDPEQAENVIYMEPSVMIALVDVIEREFPK